jgi:ABC-type Fe3+ transport system substrate-binding protein
MKMALSALAVLAALTAPPAARAQGAAEEVASYGLANAPTRLLVRGATDLEVLAPVLEAFVARRPGVRIDFEEWNTNQLNQLAEAACRGEIPAADLFISSAVDQQVKLVNDGCAQPHRSAATDALPAEENWRSEVFGITSEPTVIVYNRALVPPDEAPTSRFDLLDLLRPEGSRYAGRVATYDIEASGVGYLFAFQDSQQATTFGSLIEAFGRTGAIATCCSAEIIDGVARGRYLVAYNVIGSYALARAEENPDLAVIAPRDYTLVLHRAALIPKHAANPATAGELIDFLLSAEGREVLATRHLLVEPGDAELPLPPGVLAAPRSIPLSPVIMVGLDQQKRAQFLELWRRTFAAR